MQQHHSHVILWLYYGDAKATEDFLDSLHHHVMIEYIGEMVMDFHRS